MHSASMADESRTYSWLSDGFTYISVATWLIMALRCLLNFLYKTDSYADKFLFMQQVNYFSKYPMPSSVIHYNMIVFFIVCNINPTHASTST